MAPFRESPRIAPTSPYVPQHCSPGFPLHSPASSFVPLHPSGIPPGQHSMHPPKSALQVPPEPRGETPHIPPAFPQPAHNAFTGSTPHVAPASPWSASQRPPPPLSPWNALALPTSPPLHSSCIPPGISLTPIPLYYPHKHIPLHLPPASLQHCLHIPWASPLHPQHPLPPYPWHPPCTPR